MSEKIDRRKRTEPELNGFRHGSSYVRERVEYLAYTDSYKVTYKEVASDRRLVRKYTREEWEKRK